MTLFELSTIVVLLLVAWYFFNAMRTREMATAVARTYCRQSDIQLLDGAVSLRAMRIVKYRGKFNFKRYYEFHYSAADNIRRIGTIIIIGTDIVDLIINSDCPGMGSSVLEA